MSANTVRKYVLELEDRQLIRTEPTTIVTKDGRKRNGTLRYTIRPIQEAVDYYNEQQLQRLEADVERQRVQRHSCRDFVRHRSHLRQQDGRRHTQQREAVCRACVAVVRHGRLRQCAKQQI